MTLAVGTVVRLKTHDGCYVPMTVNTTGLKMNNLGFGGDFVETIWFDTTSRLQSAIFAVELLVVYDPLAPSGAIGSEG